MPRGSSIVRRPQSASIRPPIEPIREVQTRHSTAVGRADCDRGRGDWFPGLSAIEGVANRRARADGTWGEAKHEPLVLGHEACRLGHKARKPQRERRRGRSRPVRTGWTCGGRGRRPWRGHWHCPSVAERGCLSAAGCCQQGEPSEKSSDRTLAAIHAYVTCERPEKLLTGPKCLSVGASRLSRPAARRPATCRLRRKCARRIRAPRCRHRFRRRPHQIG